MTFFRNTMRASAAAIMALAISGPAQAATTNTISNVVFIVDESGSMSGEQSFLRNTVIDKLDTDLLAAGVTNRSYGVVGYGAANPLPRVVGTGLQNAADTKTSLGNLVTSGGFEDGWQAINFALSAFTYTAGAAINFVLVTDEDRDNGDNSLTFANVLQSLTSRNILLNAVVNNPFTSDNNNSSAVIGVDSTLEAYVKDVSGGFTTDTGGVVGNGAGTTEDDYVELALQTGGAAWNLNILRNGGNDATSFGNAFIDIKVQEITTQPPSTPVIPLPAAGWLMITGLGGLAALRRRRKAA